MMNSEDRKKLHSGSCKAIQGNGRRGVTFREPVNHPSLHFTNLFPVPWTARPIPSAAVPPGSSPDGSDFSQHVPHDLRTCSITSCQGQMPGKPGRESESYWRIISVSF
eukprot:750965-Hanusia_phi.AAC.1